MSKLNARLDQYSVWVALGWFDVMQSYRRTLFGPWWHTFNIAIFSFSMTFVYGALFGVPTVEYASYVLGGMISWFWISAVIVEGGSVFISQQHHVRNPDIDNENLIWAAAFKFSVIFAHQFVLVAGFVLVGLIDLSWNHLLVIPVLVGVFLLSLNVITILGLLFARFRDVQKLFSSSMIVIMLITPIVWKPEMMEGWRSAFVLANPFHHIIEFIRRPLLGETPSQVTILYIIGLIIFTQILARVLYKHFSKRIIFWI